MATNSVYVRKKNPYNKEYDAVTWLEQHPEDIPLARENLQVRDRGYADDDVRQLMAAICLRACVDYKRANSPKNRYTKAGQNAIDDCHKFFGGDIFQFFVNGMKVEEIERIILASPEGAISQIWRKMESNQVAKTL